MSRFFGNFIYLMNQCHATENKTARTCMRHSRILAFKHPKPRPTGNGSVSAARNSPPQGRGNVLVAHKYITSTPIPKSHKRQNHATRKSHDTVIKFSFISGAIPRIRLPHPIAVNAKDGWSLRTYLRFQEDRPRTPLFKRDLLP